MRGSITSETPPRRAAHTGSDAFCQLIGRSSRDRGLAGACRPRARRAQSRSVMAHDTLNLAALIPEHFGRYFAFFTPGHTQGIVPARIKELARLKIAALNQCDT